MAGRRTRRRRLRCFSRSAQDSGAASCWAASCTRAATAPPASSTTRSLGLGDGFDPSAAAVSAFAAELAQSRQAESTLTPPYEPREIFTAARQGDALAREVVAEVARRIALHIAPVAAVADVGLVVLGGGIGANGDLLLEPIREMLSQVAAVPAEARDLEPR